MREGRCIWYSIFPDAGVCKGDREDVNLVNDPTPGVKGFTDGGVGRPYSIGTLYLDYNINLHYSLWSFYDKVLRFGR